MIDNSDIIGAYQVVIVARRKMVHSFQCPTLKDAKFEAWKIAAQRTAKGLPTSRAFAQKIVGGKTSDGKRTPLRFDIHKIELL
jgi:hypothetical protein